MLHGAAEVSAARWSAVATGDRLPLFVPIHDGHNHLAAPTRSVGSSELVQVASRRLLTAFLEENLTVLTDAGHLKYIS